MLPKSQEKQCRKGLRARDRFRTRPFAPIRALLRSARNPLLHSTDKGATVSACARAEIVYHQHPFPLRRLLSRKGSVMRGLSRSARERPTSAPLETLKEGFHGIP